MATVPKNIVSITESLLFKKNVMDDKVAAIAKRKMSSKTKKKGTQTSDDNHMCFDINKKTYHLEKLKQFYDKVDQTSKDIIQKSTKKRKLHCKKGCSSCCVGGIFISPLEAEYIRTNVTKKPLLEEKTKNKIGREQDIAVNIDSSLEAMVRDGNTSRCSFLSNSSCTIYKYRPFACRFMGLPLRWMEEHDEFHIVGEARDICPLNESYLQRPIEELRKDECYSIDEIWEDELDVLNNKFVGSDNKYNNYVEERPASAPNERKVEEIELNKLYDTIIK